VTDLDGHHQKIPGNNMLAHEKIHRIISHQRNANLDYSEVPLVENWKHNEWDLKVATDQRNQ
jgi:hypothetical protein